MKGLKGLLDENSEWNKLEREGEKLALKQRYDDEVIREEVRKLNEHLEKERTQMMDRLVEQAVKNKDMSAAEVYLQNKATEEEIEELHEILSVHEVEENYKQDWVEKENREESYTASNVNTIINSYVKEIESLENQVKYWKNELSNQELIFTSDRNHIVNLKRNIDDYKEDVHELKKDRDFLRRKIEDLESQNALMRHEALQNIHDVEDYERRILGLKDEIGSHKATIEYLETEEIQEYVEISTELSIENEQLKEELDKLKKQYKLVTHLLKEIL